jgi:hypothetical protein
MGCDLSHPPDKEKARPFLVAYGATARAFVPDYWVDRLFDGICERLTLGEAFVISDVRYANEVRAIQDFGGVVVRVERQGFGPANSEEERSFLEIEKDFELPTVINDGTPEDLGAKVLALVK